MRHILLLTALVLGCAGCARGPDRAADSQASGSHAAEAGALAHGAWGGQIAGLPRTSLPHRQGGSFANLADRGDLVGYPAKQIVRHDGAYTWHRADISEAHAVKAILDGTLHITAPSGESLDFSYERHVEHASGDWTWVGRLKNGAQSDEVVLTFGERAAFGSIAQSGGKSPLMLTIRDGVAWLVETDRTKIASIDNPATRPKRPDFLVPPDLSASGTELSSGPSMAGLESAPVTSAVAGGTVDVVLGYTSGFAAGLGGPSQAVTRLNNMVEIANQAYVNSQIDTRVRLVHTLQVNYADNTDNGDALEKLTGYKSGTGTIPADPAFSALRAARDQYGADLVSLVRKFNTPENGGCGIAWLIGGGQSGIESGDAPFGYSVVSDGQDLGDDGKTYFCRNETLAHELGHNMGSAHDRATSTENGVLKYGVYPYSFGYKTAAGSGNFYTVMAYGDSGQTSYRIFSNPRTTFCGGFACGLADNSDNARSLAQTMPIVATFRATVVPTKGVRGDVNGDGLADLHWRNTSAQQFAHWLAGSSGALQGFASSAGFSMIAAYDVAAIGDFNGDGLSDVLWKSEADHYLILWASSGNGYVQQEIGGFEQGMTLVGSGDFDGDGRYDLLWRSLASERLRVWLMQANRVTAKWDAPMPSWFQILGVGDFDGDGRSDVVYADDVRTNLYFGKGSYFFGQNVGGRPGGWSYADSADINGDGRDDMVWLSPAQDVLSYWTMNGTAITGNPSVAVRPGETFFAARDINGDGRADLIWNAAAQLKVNIDLTGSSQRYSNGYPSGWQMRR